VIAVLYSLLWVGAAFKYGDRHWEKYYPTMLFSAVGNLLYELICYKYPMWNMEPNGLPVAMIPILLLTLVGMPVSTWIYLSNYPANGRIYRKVGYIALFIAIFIVMEYFAVTFGSITYHHDWNIMWSFLFLVFMFSIIRLHFNHPLIAWGISVVLILSLMAIFNVNFSKMK
jgi:hypothetical protein